MKTRYRKKLLRSKENMSEGNIAFELFFSLLVSLKIFLGKRLGYSYQQAVILYVFWQCRLQQGELNSRYEETQISSVSSGATVSRPEQDLD